MKAYWVCLKNSNKVISYLKNNYAAKKQYSIVISFKNIF